MTFMKVYEILMEAVKNELYSASTVCTSFHLAQWLRVDSVFDNFNQLSSVNVDRILGAVRFTTCLLDPMSSWLTKVVVYYRAL